MVHYLVMEAGSYTLPDGRAIEARLVESTLTDRRDSWVGQSLNYAHSYTTPVVLGQVMSENDADWSVFWDRGASATAPPDSSHLWVGKHVGHDSDTSRADETLGVVVIEAGTGSLGGVDYRASLGADTILGIGDSPPYAYSFSPAFGGAPQAALLSQAAMDGNDGGWAVLYGVGASPLSAAGMSLAADEDQIHDSERSHSSEQVAYLVFEEALVYPEVGITADFHAAPLSGAAPLTVTFVNETTGEVSGYEWDFGDGVTSTLENPTHVYTAPGVYTVSLMATGPGGSDTLTRTSYITVYATVVAGFVGSPTEGAAPLTVDFVNQSTGDYDTCAWDFGDNHTADDCTDPSHIYTSAGSYTVSLAVSGPGGSDALTRTGYISVTEIATPPPVAGFTATPSSGEAPLSVVFSNTTTGEATGYRWDFGDGGTSVLENPTHAYVSGGVYTVSLTAAGPGGSDTLTRTSYITVVQIDYSPIVTIAVPTEGAVVGAGDVQVTGVFSDDGVVVGVLVNDVPATLDGTTFAVTIPLTAGNQALYAAAQDDLGQAGFASRVVRVDGDGPMVGIHTPRDRQAVYSLYPSASVSYTDFYTGVNTATFSALLVDENGVITDVTNNFTAGATGASGSLGGSLAEDTVYTLTVSIADVLGNAGSDSNTFYAPPDAQYITPPEEAADAGWASGVVYASDTCNEHLTTCRGLAGVHVTVAPIDHETRATSDTLEGAVVSGPDGFFAFPVEETGFYALRFGKEGYTYGQREAAVVRQRSTAVGDVYLTPLDANVTTCAYPITQTVVHTSADGSLVVEIPPHALGPGQEVDVTATNYEHVEFLPSGGLPPGTWETYAFNLGGDSEVQFTRPITVRLQNSREFPPGAKIPLGYWNQETLQWEHAGVGVVDDAGDWLVMHVDHFSNFDCNDPVTSPGGLGIDGGGEDESGGDGRCPDGEDGCFIGLKSGQVRERIELPPVSVLGQPAAPTLGYDTSRANPSEVIDVRLDFDVDPQFVFQMGNYVQFELYVEGQKTDSFTFAADLDGSGEVGRYRYLWDGRNALGEPLPPGVYAYAVKLSVPYTGQYYWSSTGKFGGPPNLAMPTGVLVEATQDFWTYGAVALDAQPDSALGSGWVLEGQQRLTEDKAGRIVVAAGDELAEYYLDLTDQLNLAQYDVTGPPITGPAAEVVFPPAPEDRTEVSDTIYVDTTWTQANSPYVVTGDSVVVDYNATLTIEPGVTVMFGYYESLIAEGRLHAVGTVTEPITFTAYNDGPYEAWNKYDIPATVDTVAATTADEYGNVWFGGENTIARLRSDLETWDSYNLCYGLQYTWCADGINDVATDAQGQVWIATNNGAAVLSTTNTVSLTVYQESDNGLSNNTVYAIAVDNETGHVWFGTYDGADRFIPGAGWTHYDEDTCLSGARISSIVVDDDSHVWFGTDDGLCEMNAEGDWTAHNAEPITNIALDLDGNVWMVVEDNGIRALTDSGWMTYTAGEELVSDYISSIAVDGSNRKWVGYYDYYENGGCGEGVGILSADNQTWFHEMEPRLSGNQVVDIAVLPDGSVWVGTFTCEMGEWCVPMDGYRATHVHQIVPHSGTASGGYWGYVQIRNSDSRLSHVVVENGGVEDTPSVYLDESAPTLDHLTIRGSGGDGLYAQGGTGFTLDTATIEGNEGSGVRIEGITSGYVLTGVTSQYNNGHGMYLEYTDYAVVSDVQVTGATLAHNLGYGIFTRRNTADDYIRLVVQDSTIEHNAVAARLPANISLGDNTWLENERNRIEWISGTIGADCAWNEAVDTHVILGDVTVADGVTLTIPAGTTVLFDGNYRINVDGALSAVGTDDEPIYFGPSNDGDDWYGLIFHHGGVDDEDGPSRLSYATIHGAERGLYPYQTGQNALSLDHLNLVKNEYGLYVYNSNYVAIHDSNFISNVYGIHNTWPSFAVDATGNYWNAPSGPHHSTSNPDGTGDEVSNGVTFDPWLTKPLLIAGLQFVAFNRTATDHTTLAYYDEDGTFTRYYPDGREVHFDAEGRHDYTLEPDGRRTAYTYDADTGAVTEMAIVVSDGEEDWTWTWTFDYDENGKLAQITDPAGRVTEFAVDANGDLAQVTFPDESSRQFYYDERGLLTQQVDQGGSVTSYVYDDYGRLTQHVAPLREVYDPETGQTAPGQETRAFTPSDTAYALINDSPVGDPDDPASAVPTSTLLVDGVSYGRGGRTGHTNKWGQWTDQTDALDRTTTYARDESNNLTRMTLPEGNALEVSYDDTGNFLHVAHVSASQMQTTSMTYEPRFNRVKTATDEQDKTTIYTYDYELGLGEAGNLVRIEYPPMLNEHGVLVTPVVSYTYNTLGLKETETDKRGTVMRYVYTLGTSDEAYTGATPLFAPGVTPVPGLLTQIIQDDGGIAKTTIYKDFDALGNAQTTIGPDGNATHYTYDEAGRVVSTTNAMSITTLNEYNAAGQLIATTIQWPDDPTIQLTQYEYDATGRQLAQRTTAGDLMLKTQTYYDIKGQLIGERDALGYETRYIYDAAGQLINMIDPLGNTITKTYTLNGRREYETDAAGYVTHYVYDGFGRLTQEIRDEGGLNLTTVYTYDMNNNRVATMIPNGTVTCYGYDSFNRRTAEIQDCGAGPKSNHPLCL